VDNYPDNFVLAPWESHLPGRSDGGRSPAWWPEPGLEPAGDLDRDQLAATVAGRTPAAYDEHRRVLDNVRAGHQAAAAGQGLQAGGRELEVLALVAAGKTNREAAARLFLSEATVKTHLLNIYAKLNAADRASAVAEAYKRGLL
jgi:ATP/maltotriose-dependent transcriptional regulator MalT